MSTAWARKVVGNADAIEVLVQSNLLELLKAQFFVPIDHSIFKYIW